MEKIRNFVENLFAGLPDTPEVREAKHHLMEVMGDQYEDLLSQGKNENEALGIVVSEFGSMEEIKAELGLSGSAQAQAPSRPQPQSQSQPAPAPREQPCAEAAPEPFPRREYDAFQREFSLAIAGGVVLCILAVASQLLLEEFWGPESNFPTVIFFLLIAAAVCLFVYYGSRKSQYDQMLREMNRRNPGGAPAGDAGASYAAYSPQEWAEMRRNRRLAGGISTVIMMSATLIFLFIGFTTGMWHPGWVVFPIGGVLCAIVELVLGVNHGEDD